MLYFYKLRAKTPLHIDACHSGSREVTEERVPVTHLRKRPDSHPHRSPTHSAVPLLFLGQRPFPFFTHRCLVSWWLRMRLPVQEMQKTLVQLLGWEEPLEKEMATHCSPLAWKVPWTEEPGGPQSLGKHRPDRTERLACRPGCQPAWAVVGLPGRHTCQLVSRLIPSTENS